MKNVLKAMAECQQKSLAYNIVALGDSVTDGCFRKGKDFDAVWHARLKKALNGIFPSLRINMINSGVNGDTTTGALNRLERDVFAYQPDLVIICLGLNNICGELDVYLTHVGEMIKRIREHGAEVIFMTPNMVDTEVRPKELIDIFSEQWAVDYAEKLSVLQNGTYVDEMFEKVKKVASEQGAVVCDAYSAWRNLSRAGVNVTDLLINRINHPSQEMHAVFTAMLLNTILMCENE